MEGKPIPAIRRLMVSGAVVFGGIAVAKFLRHDPFTGLWSFAVCFAFSLGLLAARLTVSQVVSEVAKPEKYTLTP